ncbi:MAG: Gfo/Idh/MocA family oxidoreductase [Chloroflexi bacterium]|nr:Gfo/Idh/MocA family oxidoreductase [Chloroflexota bacterium]
MSKVKIGFVGVGGMGQCAHLKNYVTVPDCEVVAIAEIRPELRKAVAAKYGIPRTYADHNAMLAAEKVDAIVSAQPFTRHGTLIPELLQAGVPVMTEKPLAGSIEMGEKVVAAAKTAGTWQMLGYHKRSDPATIYAKAEIKRLLETKELGALRYVRVLMPAGDWVANGFIDLVRSNESYPELPGDPAPKDMSEALYKEYISFVNYYIHQVNLLRHLLGEPYKVTYADPSGVLLAVTSTSGIAGTIEMSPYTTTIDWHESALVAFEHGYIKIELPAPLASNRPGRVEIFRDPGQGETPQTIIPSLPWVHAMRQQAMNFVSAVKGEMAPMTDSAEALEDLKVAREYIRLLRGA